MALQLLPLKALLDVSNLACVVVLLDVSLNVFMPKLTRKVFYVKDFTSHEVRIAGVRQRKYGKFYFEL